MSLFRGFYRSNIFHCVKVCKFLSFLFTPWSMVPSLDNPNKIYFHYAQQTSFQPISADRQHNRSMRYASNYIRNQQTVCSLSPADSTANISLSSWRSDILHKMALPCACKTEFLGIKSNAGVRRKLLQGCITVLMFILDILGLL